MQWVFLMDKQIYCVEKPLSLSLVVLPDIRFQPS